MCIRDRNKTPAGCGAFLGGISKNFGSNLLFPPENSPWIVAEADEYDRSFLQLNPTLALITSIDADHLDIFENKEKITESFGEFATRIKPEGKLIIKKGVELDIKNINAQIYSYSPVSYTHLDVYKRQLFGADFSNNDKHRRFHRSFAGNRAAAAMDKPRWNFTAFHFSSFWLLSLIHI